MKKEKATFGAGCFWNIQKEFDKLPVIKTTVGYIGGSEKFPNPSYEQVSSGKTINPKKDRGTAPLRAESQQRYFEVLGSRIADRAYKLYVQRGP